jgi:hypothetical protein
VDGVYAAVPLAIGTGEAFKGWGLAILSNFLVLALAGGTFYFGVRAEWGKFLAFLAGGVVAAMFVWSPDTAKTTMTELSAMVFGG